MLRKRERESQRSETARMWFKFRLIYCNSEILQTFKINNGEQGVLFTCYLMYIYIY